MASLTKQVRGAALDAGAALVGFAPIRRFDNAPPELHPRTIFPQTQTVIAIALPQPRGALKAVEEGTYWQAYNCDSYWYLNEVEAPRVLRRIAMFLEMHGWTSVPVHNPFHSHTGRQTQEDQPAGPDGMVSLRVIGCAAGLGELGRSKVFLTPQFGPRQRVFALFTDAQLEPTPLLTESVCDDCGACARGCQAGAIGSQRTETFEIEGRKFSHAPLDCRACGVVHRGDDPRYNPFLKGDEPVGTASSYSQFLQHRFRHLAICVGRGCVRSCLDHLEKTGRLSAKFHTPMIQRKRWEPSPPPAAPAEGDSTKGPDW